MIDPSDLEMRMAAAIMFMPEIGHLPVPVTREIVQRCARVAEEEFRRRLERAVEELKVEGHDEANWPGLREGVIET